MIPVELLLACDKNTLRNLLNTCHDINKLADEHFWKLRTNDIQTDETWLKSYKRLTINYGTVNDKNDIIKYFCKYYGDYYSKVNRYYLTKDRQLFQDDQLIFDKVKDFFVTDIIVILTIKNNVFRSRSITKIKFDKIAENVTKLLYSCERRDIFYTSREGTYQICDDFGGYEIVKVLNIEVLDLWIKPDTELMGRIYNIRFITKDGQYGFGLEDRLTIKESTTKFISLTVVGWQTLCLLTDQFELYYEVDSKFKLIRKNVAKLVPDGFITKADKLYNFDKQLLAEDLVSCFRDEYIIKSIL